MAGSPRFWVGGAGTWDSSTTTHWASSTGGASGASAPTAADSVTFDANSGLGSGGTVTIAATAVCGGCVIGGINSKTVIFSLSGNVTWSAGTYTFSGNDATTPIIFQSSTIGTQRTLTINGTHSGHSWVHFADIAIAGTAGTLTGTLIGNCFGCSGITFEPAVTQTATGTASFTWSTHGWTTRVPLPQDNVVISNAFIAGRTITADMPRLGADITFACTGSPAFVLSAAASNFYGSMTLASGMTWSTANQIQPAGRGNHSLNAAGVTVGANVTVNAFGGTYTMQGDWTMVATTTLTINSGTWDANNYNVTAKAVVSGSGLTRAIKMGNGTWTLSGTGTTTVWNLIAGGLTVTCGLSTIDITSTDSGVTKTFVGAGLTYNTLRHTTSGTAGLTITGNNTFANLLLQCDSARTITLPASGTQTVTSTLLLQGAASGTLSIVSSTPTTQSTISKASGNVVARWASLTDSNATGGATFTAELSTVTNGGNNAGWTFGQPPAGPSVYVSSTGRALQITADGQDITRLVESVTFSNSDPGGFEVASVDPKAGVILRPGTELAVRRGLDYAWHGRILDPGEHDKHGKSNRQLSAVGYGHQLDDKPFSMIYADRDLSRWVGAGSSRRISVASVTVPRYELDEWTQTTDTVAGIPALHASLFLNGSGAPDFEAWYDAGQGNSLSAVYYDWTSNNWLRNSLDDGNAFTRFFDCTDDNSSNGVQFTPLNNTALSGTGYQALTGGRRYVALQHLYNTVLNSSPTIERYAQIRKITVYGDHGLLRRGDDPGGFYPSDIAAYAVLRSGAGFRLLVDTSDSFIINHSVYYDPTGPTTQISDMAKLVAWHWGVWEPGGGFDNRPTFMFTAPPADATAVIDRYSCDEFEAPRVDFDKLYNVAQVRYTDPAGVAGYVEVSLPDGRLDASGVTRRVLNLDMGIGSAGAASAYGVFALRLAQRSARSGGSVTIRGNVRLPNGGFKPADLLRAGRDRIRLTGLKDGGDLMASDTRALDTFLVRRVESTARADGSMSTRIDFDQGVDLLEVLQARLSAAASAIGEG